MLTKNSFDKGLQSDLAKTKNSQATYLDALNMRVITEEGSSSFAIENTKGNKLDITLPTTIAADIYETDSENGLIAVPQQNNPIIIGWTNVNTTIVIFSTTGSGYLQIWTVVYNESTDTASTPTMLYNRDMGVSTQNRIKAYGRYESSRCQRVYFADALNPLRTFNIANVDPLNVPYRTFDIQPATHFNLPVVIKLLPEGNLPNCKIQYFYRLVHKDGAITQFSPTSLIYSLINGDEEGEFQDYPGLAEDYKEDAENKEEADKLEFSSETAIKLYIPKVDKDYDYIQLGCIQWLVKDVPKIYLFPVTPVLYGDVDAQYNPSGAFNSFEFIHTGWGQGEFTISREEYAALINTFTVPKTFAVKQSIMYTANTENVQFDVDFDARAYRFDNTQISKTYQENDSSSGGLETTILGVAPNYPADETLDSWNPYNVENDTNWLTSQYKYKANGTTLGGEGPNVSYEFIMLDQVCDENYYDATANFPTLASPTDNPQDFEDGIPFVNMTKDNAPTYDNGVGPQFQNLQNSFPNLKSPYREAVLTGYARGEVYPFALVLEDETGRVSFAKWIGDIKFPYNTDYDDLSVLNPPGDYSYFYEQSAGLDFRTRSLGIKFYITLPEEFQNYSVRIVRMERKPEYMTKLGTGITGTFELKYNLAFSFSDLKNCFIYLFKKYVTLLMSSSGFIGIVLGSLFEDQIEAMIDDLFTNKITQQAQSVFENNVTEEGVEEMIATVISQFGSGGGGLFSPVAGVIGEQVAKKITVALLSLVKDKLKKEVGGIDLSILSISAGIGKEGAEQDQGFLISPTIQFPNKYNSRTNDYLRFIYPYDTIAEKVTRVYHRDKKTGVLERQNSTAIYRKWYCLTRALTYGYANQITPFDADPGIRTITKHNMLDPGEIVKSTWDNNTYGYPTTKEDGSTIIRGATYVNAYIGHSEKYEDDGKYFAGLQKISQRHKIQGIGDRKMLFKLSAPAPSFSTGTSITLYDNQADGPSGYVEYGLSIHTPQNAPLWNGQQISLPRIADDYGDYIVSLERYIEGQYGGASYAARALREYNVQVGYIPNHEISSFTNFPIKCWNGDTYVGVYDAVNYGYYFEQLPGYEPAEKTKKALADIFPCECPFNFNLREGKHFARSQDTDSLDVTEKRVKKRLRKLKRQAKKSGIDYNTAAELILPKRFIFDTFKFNDVYTQQSNIKTYVPNPVIDLFVSNNFNRVWKSQFKFDGELVDSFRQFKALDFLDVEGTYGPINELVVFKDSLVFYQDNAFGIVTTNERATTTDTKSNTLAIASSVPLSRFDYASLETGCKHRFAVVVTDASLFHFDVNKKKLFKFDSGLTPLSDIEGLAGYFRTLATGNIITNDNTISLVPAGIHGEFYPEFNTVFYTFKNYIQTVEGPIVVTTYTTSTISYNLLLQAFESRHSFTPGLYLRTANRLLSSNSDNKGYSHNKGNYGEFYGTYYNSFIKFRTNEHPEYPKTFTNQTIYTEVIDSTGANLPTETISSIQCTNDFQDTGVINSIMYPTTSYNMRRRERGWHFYIPRDINPAAYTTLKARMRDIYLDTTLTYANNNNKRIILHDILTEYTPSIS